MRIRQLFGDGLITNDCYTVNDKGEATCNHALRPFGTQYSEFSGVIAGNLSISSQGRIDLTGENNVIQGSFSAGFNKVQGERSVCIAKIGNAGEPSSIGGGATISLGPDYGGYLLYLGANETSDKNFTLAAGTSGLKYYNTIDAGAYGGLVLTGNLNYRSNKENSYMVNAMFTGSNAAPCEYKGNISEYFAITVDGVKYTNTYFVTKSGSGTWRFSGARNMGGGFAVENGVLEFDSLAETNKICALGKATMLTPAGQFGRYVNLPKVPYAYTLGSGKTDDEGIMRYIGDEAVYVKTRPSVLKGRGGFENNGTAPFRYYGVSALDAGEKCLILGGSNTDENILGDVISGAEGAVVSIEKRGSGTWTLAGEQTFNGDLHVKAGKLIVRRPEHYTWYKWLIKELYSTGERWTEVTEFGLFDKDGNRQNSGLSFAEDKNKILPGTTRIVPTRDDLLMMNADNVIMPEVVTNLMDDLSQYFKVGLTKNADAESRDYYKPSNDNSDGWVPVVMRLRDDASEVASFDWVLRYKSTDDSHTRTPKIYSVLGSMDGYNWDELFTTNTIAYDMNSGHWKYAGTKYTIGLTASTQHMGGQEIASSPSGYTPPEVLSNVRYVRVDPGAVLELAEGDITLSSLSVDCAAGAGEIKGFKFASDGILNLINVSSIDRISDVNIDLSEAEDWTNIAGWTLMIDGASDDACKYCFTVSENCIRVAKRGLRFIVR
jgi:autotransporter-associated beta strand protein